MTAKAKAEVKRKGKKSASIDVNKQQTKFSALSSRTI
jgi:hypothetical protein